MLTNRRLEILCMVFAALVMAAQCACAADNDWDDWEEADEESCGYACADFVFLKIEDVTFKVPVDGVPCPVTVTFSNTAEPDSDADTSIAWAALFFSVNDDLEHKTRVPLECSEFTCQGIIPAQRAGSKITFALAAADKNGSLTTQGFRIPDGVPMERALIPNPDDMSTAKTHFDGVLSYLDHRLAYDDDRLYIEFAHPKQSAPDPDENKMFLFEFSPPDDVIYSGFMVHPTLVFAPVGNWYSQMIMSLNEKDIQGSGETDPASQEAQLSTEESARVDAIVQQGLLVYNFKLMMDKTSTWQDTTLEADPRLESSKNGKTVISLRRVALGDQGRDAVRSFSLKDYNSSSGEVDGFAPKLVEGCRYHMFYFTNQTYVVKSK